MEEKSTKRRLRRMSTWMSDAAESIACEEEILAGKMIVLKIIQYMEDNNMTQKQLAEKLNVSPQYINKFLHGLDCDIKISTAIRYGRILNLKLIEIPGAEPARSADKVVVYAQQTYKVETASRSPFVYNSVYSQQLTYN
ncbi:MAG: helix-turn-helix transcriptional regulator [Muribaculaceae bacterium]|nr:helix-turn-helix transcriptional regulator [Muribaculaceae bacterium]